MHELFNAITPAAYYVAAYVFTGVVTASSMRDWDDPSGFFAGRVLIWPVCWFCRIVAKIVS